LIHIKNTRFEILIVKSSSNFSNLQIFKSSNCIMKDWPLWEVFIRSKNGLEHRHCGSLHAADATMALENARDVYTRRNEGVSIWVVPSAQITASQPEENAELFEPAADKAYRHPTFYILPEELKHM
jgi:ring-1,2-phenylacetyl-CoA epoxidase subunit PaaB